MDVCSYQRILQLLIIIFTSFLIQKHLNLKGTNSERSAELCMLRVTNDNPAQEIVLSSGEVLKKDLAFPLYVYYDHDRALAQQSLKCGDLLYLHPVFMGLLLTCQQLCFTVTFHLYLTVYILNQSTMKNLLLYSPAQIRQTKFIARVYHTCKFHDTRGRGSCARAWPYKSYSENALFL